MARRKTVREMELDAAAEPPSRAVGRPALGGEAAAMLTRRGLRPRTTRLDLPFPPDLTGTAAEQLSALLGHYAFSLFLRSAIHKPEGFAADEATGYLKGARASAFAEALVGLGVAVPVEDGRYRLARPATSFGPTLGTWRASSGDDLPSTRWRA